MPHEIDWFEWQSKQLKIGSYFLNKEDKIIVDVTLNLNFINWDQSQIPKQYFINKFEQIKKLYDWCDVLFETDDINKCLGCGDKRKQSINSSQSDNIIYLDSDIIFKPETLFYLLEASKIVNNEYYIITPQLNKMWDTSWDVLVNSYYISNVALHDLYNSSDPFKIVNDVIKNINLKSIDSFKFGGGWFTLISTNLLKLTDIPDDINPYGPDDTYVMLCSGFLKSKKYDIKQYILENIVVTENIKYRNNPYSEFISNDEENEKQRKSFRSQSDANLIKVLDDFIQKISK